MPTQFAQLPEPADKPSVDRWQGGGGEAFARFLADVEPAVVNDKHEVVPLVPDQDGLDQVCAALDRRPRLLVISWPRRHGKTLMASALVMWRFLTIPASQTLLVSNSANQSIGTQFKQIRLMVNHTRLLAGMKKQGAIELHASGLRFPRMASELEALPANSGTIVGRRVTTGSLTEYHASHDFEILDALVGGTMAERTGLVIIDSTATARDHPLYALKEKAADPESGVAFCHRWYRDAADYEDRRPPWITVKAIRSTEATVLPQVWRVQHLNHFASSDSSLFPDDVMERVVEDDYPLDLPALTEGRPFVVTAGLDRAQPFAGHGDKTALACVLKVATDDEPEYYVLDARHAPFSLARTIKNTLAEYHDRFGMAKAAIEAFQATDIQEWASVQRWESELIHPSAPRQTTAFSALASAAREGRLHVHKSFDRLLSEMRQMSYRITGNSGGTPIGRFQAAKGHDDMVYALLWAFFAGRDQELANYQMSGIECSAAASAQAIKSCLLLGGTTRPLCADDCGSYQEFEHLYARYRQNVEVAALDAVSFRRHKLRINGPVSTPRTSWP
ncbi:MAG: hypothetical protein RID91_16090 [Azospirillaceae bacterium]